MEQMSFLPNSRKTDPESSHLAGEEMTASGKRKHHMQIVSAAVNNNPGLTSLELSTKIMLDRYQTARRLPDAESKNLVKRGPERICKVGNRSSVTWWPKNHKFE